MKRHFKIFLLITQHVLNYRARNLVWFIEAMINPIILLLFWQGAVSGGTRVENWTVNDIRSYYLYLMVATVFLMHSVEQAVAKNDIKDGGLEAHLLRPFPYTFLRFYSEAPWRFIQLFYALITLIILSIVFRIDLTFVTNAYQFISAIIIMILAYILSYLFKILIGFISFWIIDTHSIREVNELLIIMLAGLILPIPFYPEWMQSIVVMTPYPYIIYYPSVAFAGLLNNAELVRVIGIQGMWIIFFGVLYFIVWKRGLKVFTGVGQ